MDEQPKITVLSCPHCGNHELQAINETETSGGGYNAAGGCCGYLLMGPLGLLCGACNSKATSRNQNYWICSKCGHKFKM